MAIIKETGSKPKAKPRSGPTNGYEAAAAQSAAKAANNYKQGITNGTPANTYGAAPKISSTAKSGPASPNYGGTNNTRSTYDAQMSGEAPLGYTPGSADDPAVRAYWQQVFDAGNAASTGPANWEAPATYTPEPVAPPVAPAVYETPAQYTPPARNELPAAISGASSSVANAPTGQSFTALGSGLMGPAGMFDRMRNQRSPKSGISVTPELLRRAAQTRLG